MYIPNLFKVTNIDEIWDFVQENSFGTIVTTDKGTPIASHLPFQLMKEGDTYYLTGHMAHQNPQWQTFADCEDVLVMFQGPHTYISSAWYEEEEVPTWNYQAVHVYGSVSILSEEELQEDLTMLLKTYESDREDPVLWDTLSTQTKKQIKGIVGFKIKINDIQAAYKLSQNRKDKDYQNIIDQLNETGDSHSQQVADVMAKRFNR